MACLSVWFFIFEYTIKEVVIMSVISILGANWFYDQLKPVLPTLYKLIKR